MTRSKLNNFLFAVSWSAVLLLVAALIVLLAYGDNKVSQCMVRGFDHWDVQGGCYNIVRTYEKGPR